MFKFRLLQLPLFLLALISQASAQFAHTDHKQIVDASSKPLLLRATNLGNWLVPEGYMWLFQGGPQSPSEIRALVLELLGPEGSAAFWQKYRENYVTREDIALLHRAGFNAIRVPLHYSLFESDDAEGFKLLDRLIGWSRAENLYVILDLHAAPGGQTGTNIDDSAGYPWLYQSPQEQERLMAIWRGLATHYRDEPAVLGYDLLNEPIPPVDWGKIVEFAKLPRGTGQAEERLKARPEQETLTRAFAELLENVRLQKCRVNEGYLRALGMKTDIAPVSAGGAAN